MMLREAIKVLLEVQELDIQMIWLMRLKRERLNELNRVRTLRDDLHHQVILKESEVIELKTQVRVVEGEVSDCSERIQKLETQQAGVRKVEEFNALTHEISGLEREKASKEQRLSDLYDKMVTEEDYLKNLKSTFDSAKQNSIQMESEIIASIEEINQEGQQIMQKRSVIAENADPAIMPVYEKLLQNKKDRVIVPIENRCCSGCHIAITPQHENVVRKGERLCFCEHCSRIHYWIEHVKEKVAVQGAAKRRRRRAVVEGNP